MQEGVWTDHDGSLVTMAPKYGKFTVEAKTNQPSGYEETFKAICENEANWGTSKAIEQESEEF